MSRAKNIAAIEEVAQVVEEVEEEEVDNDLLEDNDDDDNDESEEVEVETTSEKKITRSKRNIALDAILLENAEANGNTKAQELAFYILSAKARRLQANIHTTIADFDAEFPKGKVSKYFTSIQVKEVAQAIVAAIASSDIEEAQKLLVRQQFMLDVNAERDAKLKASQKKSADKAKAERKNGKVTTKAA